MEGDVAPIAMFGADIQEDAELLVDRLRNSFESIAAKGRKPNVLVAGCTGAGKSTLINRMFGQNVAQTGSGIPITQHFDRYELPMINIYDSKGLEVGNHTEFIEQTTAFLDERQADTSQEPIDVCWYVVNSAASRFQPFEGEVCSQVFDRLGIIFILNKADIASDADRESLRESIKSLQLANCIAVLNAVSLEKPVTIPDLCPQCQSDDLDFRKKLRIIRCETCGFQGQLGSSPGLDMVVQKTFDTLPFVTAERFVASQRVSMHAKNVAARRIVEQAYKDEEALERAGSSGGGRMLEDGGRAPMDRMAVKRLTNMLCRLAVLWDLKHGLDFGRHVAEQFCGGQPLSSAKSMRDRMYALLSSPKKGGAGPLATADEPAAVGPTNAHHVAAVGVVWNRCVRSLYKSLVSEVFVEDEVSRAAHMNDLMRMAFARLSLAAIDVVETRLVADGDVDIFLDEEFPLAIESDSVCQIAHVSSAQDLAALERGALLQAQLSPRFAYSSPSSDRGHTPPPGHGEDGGPVEQVRRGSRMARDETGSSNSRRNRNREDSKRHHKHHGKKASVRASSSTVGLGDHGNGERLLIRSKSERDRLSHTSKGSSKLSHTIDIQLNSGGVPAAVAAGGRDSKQSRRK
jgi:GTP-binding protein EngB required for normal cell division